MYYFLFVYLSKIKRNKHLKIMKITKTGEANSTLRAKKSLKITFNRFGNKGGAYTKELFWIQTTNSIGEVAELKALTLEDLKKIVELSEELIEIADKEI